MVRITRRQAEAYRAIIEAGAESLTDKQALHAPLLFRHWKPDEDYAANTRLCFDGVLYRVLIPHTSQISWTPDVAPSLFAKVLISDPGEVSDWEQPDSTNTYMFGDKVRHKGKIWVSEIDYNAYEPGIYGWKEQD